MGFTLTPASLKKLCRELNLYSSAPELNDVLHLQCKGICKIENLDEYTGLKTIYLEQNAIDTIENLDKLVNLRCLYLGRNALTEITGLQTLAQLDTLDLSDNYISSASGLSCLPALRTLNLSGNKLRREEDVAPLLNVPSLTSLDLANNAIEEPCAIDTVASMPLSYLRLMGNPAVREYKHYRKRLLAGMPSLNYLDDSPAFARDVRLARAFMEGGVERERAERDVIRAEEDAERERHRQNFDAMVERARQQPPVPHDPMRFRAVPIGESDSDDEGLPPGYSRKERRAKEAAAAAAAAQKAIEAKEAAAAAQAPADTTASADNGPSPERQAAPAPTAEPPAAAAAATSVPAMGGSHDTADVEPEPRAAVPVLNGSLPELVVRRDEAATTPAAQPTTTAPPAPPPPPAAAAAAPAAPTPAAPTPAAPTPAAPTPAAPTPAASSAAGLPAVPLSEPVVAPLASSRMPVMPMDAFKAELAERAASRQAVDGRGVGAPAAAPTARVWGSAQYRRLWDMALSVGEQQEAAQAHAALSVGEQQEAAQAHAQAHSPPRSNGVAGAASTQPLGGAPDGGGRDGDGNGPGGLLAYAPPMPVPVPLSMPAHPRVSSSGSLEDSVLGMGDHGLGAGHARMHGAAGGDPDADLDSARGGERAFGDVDSANVSAAANSLGRSSEAPYAGSPGSHSAELGGFGIDSTGTGTAAEAAAQGSSSRVGDASDGACSTGGAPAEAALGPGAPAHASDDNSDDDDDDDGLLGPGGRDLFARYTVTTFGQNQVPRGQPPQHLDSALDLTRPDAHTAGAPPPSHGAQVQSDDAGAELTRPPVARPAQHAPVRLDSASDAVPRGHAVGGVGTSAPVRLDSASDAGLSARSAAAADGASGGVVVSPGAGATRASAAGGAHTHTHAHTHGPPASDLLRQARAIVGSTSGAAAAAGSAAAVGGEAHAHARPAPPSADGAPHPPADPPRVSPSAPPPAPLDPELMASVRALVLGDAGGGGAHAAAGAVPHRVRSIERGDSFAEVVTGMHASPHAAVSAALAVSDVELYELD